MPANGFNQNPPSQTRPKPWPASDKARAALMRCGCCAWQCRRTGGCHARAPSSLLQLGQQQLGKCQHHEGDERRNQAQIDQRGLMGPACFGKFIRQRRGDAVHCLEGHRQGINWFMLPITKVTAMVSPKARPARDAAHHPSWCGQNHLRDHFPSGRPDQSPFRLSAWVASSNTSRITEAMKE